MAPSDVSRSSYAPLSVKPIDFSLTAGTSIPAPLDSPPQSPASYARPPTSGGGPLTSHPTTPEEMPGAFPPTPEPENEMPRVYPPTLTTNGQQQSRTDSFKTPISPASASANTTSPEPQRRPSGVRKLFSMNSLRSSFNSSRTSLNTARDSHEVQQPMNGVNGVKRPSSPSIMSSTASSHDQPRPQLRQKRSSNWFKRKSSMFMMNADNELAAVDEDQRPDTRESKRMRELSPAPLLPEIGAFSGGEIGWDEGLFKR